MTERYPTSPTSLRSLQDRLSAAAKRQGVLSARLQRHVGVLVVTRFMESVTGSGEPVLLVKGGASLELRRGISESRTSKDLDMVLRGEMGSVHDALVTAGAVGWEGFTAHFTPPEPFEVPGLSLTPYRFKAKLNFRGRAFVTVPIEVSPIEAGNAETFDPITSSALSLVGLPETGAVPCMTLPWQVAQKVHACTAVAPDRANDRAHDLVDLQLLEALLAGEALDVTRDACVAVFGSRAQHAWPPVVDAKPHWGPIYAKALEGLGDLELADTVDDAVVSVQQFIDRIQVA